MKALRVGAFALVAAILLVGLSAAVAVAGVDPSAAPYVDSQTHAISGNTSQWYRFEYAGGNSVITVRVPLGAREGLGLEVYTPDQLKSWWSATAVGAGSPQGDDLLWQGRFPTAGTFAVEIINNKPYAVSFGLQFTGSAASFSPPVAAPVVVSTVKVPPIANMDPVHALAAVDAKGQYIPGNTTLWYSFKYTGGHSQALVTLAGGNANRLRMHIHNPEQMQTWWSSNPVGKGNPKADDLIWLGNACECGAWYVEVVNDNPYGVAFDLSVTGGGVIQ